MFPLKSEMIQVLYRQDSSPKFGCHHFHCIRMRFLFRPFYPLRLAFIPCCLSKQGVVLSIGIHYVNYMMAFVFGNTIIGYGVGYLFAIGGNTQTAYASHCPQGFGVRRPSLMVISCLPIMGARSPVLPVSLRYRKKLA